MQNASDWCGRAEINGGIEEVGPGEGGRGTRPTPIIPSMQQFNPRPSRRYEDPESFFIRSSHPDNCSPTSETDVPAFSNAPFTRSP